MKQRSRSEGSLTGRFVFLAAAMPDWGQTTYRRTPNADIWIDEAVASFARCVFYQQGRVITTADDLCVSLLVSVAEEYKEIGVAFRASDESKFSMVNVYRVGARENHSAKWWMSPNECFNVYLSKRGGLMDANEQLLEAVDRDVDVAAMVCIGGMDDVHNQANYFVSASDRPVYAIGSTGGAAAKLIQNPQVVDAERRFMSGNDSEPVPYPWLMSRLIAEIAEASSRREW